MCYHRFHPVREMHQVLLEFRCLWCFSHSPPSPSVLLLSPRRALGVTHISLLSTWRWVVQSCPGRNPHPSSIRSALGRIGSNRAHSRGETQLLSLVINIDKHTVERCSNKVLRSLKKPIYYKEKCFGALVSLTQALSQSTPCCVAPLASFLHHLVGTPL